MRIRWLGWAGVEIEAEGERLLVDPLQDPAATFAWMGDSARAQVPEVTAPEAGRQAAAGLLTHLHRDHADAGALAGALADGAPVLEPPRWPGAPIEDLAVAQAHAELSDAGLAREQVSVWETRQVGPFSVAALPAVDGLGDSQVAWLIEGEGRRVLHLGDTIFHSYWWRMARRHGPFDIVLAPINGAVISFPHLQPASPLAGTMEPEQTAIAAEILGASMVVPIHYNGYSAEGFYQPAEDALRRFEAAASERQLQTRVLGVGESIGVG